MANRDYIKEILDRNGRLSSESDRFSNLLTRLEPIYQNIINYRDVYLEDEEVQSRAITEAAKYLPIGLVACYEGYFKLVIRDLIDHGSPYSENVTEFKNLSIDIETVLAIQGEKISLGDFVSHLLSYNNFNDINKSLSTIIGEDFRGMIKNFDSSEIQEVDRKIQSDLPSIFPKVDNIFRMRHVFCHELASDYEINIEKLINDANGCIFIFRITEVLINHLTQNT